MQAQPNRVAFVEDHPRLAALVSRGLAAEGFAVDVYADVASAWRGLRERSYAVAIIDRGLPDGDGLALIRRLRAAHHSLPCLVLTAQDALRDRVDGLDAGADDYLTKPFALEELAARIRALMRRPSEFQPQRLALGDISVQPDEGRLCRAEENVSISPAEVQILLCLIRAEGSTVRRRLLEDAAWGIATPVTPNALDVAVHRLRRKLAAIGSTLRLVNIRGFGFSLQE